MARSECENIEKQHRNNERKKSIINNGVMAKSNEISMASIFVISKSMANEA
jgi:hypothetical protein